MQYRNLGHSGIQLSPLTFGAWAIGNFEIGGVSPSDTIAAIRTAYDLGFTSIDTGPLYGFGFSEEVVGQAIRDLPRHRLQIITKCGVVWEGDKGYLWYPDKTVNGRLTNIYKYSGKESIIRECEASLRRLGTDYIDVYSIHWPDPTTPIEESMEAFSQLIRQGKIRAAGCSNLYSVPELRKAGSVVPIASDKVRFNMLNRRIQSELVPFCRDNHIGIMAYSVLQRGILTGRDLPKFLWSKDDDPREVALYEPENSRRIRNFLDKLTPIAMDHGATLTQLGIRWVIDQPGITVALLGATSPEQIAYDAKAMDISLGDSDRAAIGQLLDELEPQLEFQSAPTA